MYRSTGLLSEEARGLWTTLFTPSRSKLEFSMRQIWFKSAESHDGDEFSKMIIFTLHAYRASHCTPRGALRGGRERERGGKRADAWVAPDRDSWSTVYCDYCIIMVLLRLLLVIGTVNRRANPGRAHTRTWLHAGALATGDMYLLPPNHQNRPSRLGMYLVIPTICTNTNTNTVLPRTARVADRST